MKNIIFLRTAWMKNYCGITEDDKPLKGGAFIEENGWGGEIYNFKAINGKIYGYVRAGNKETSRIDISKLGAAKTDKYIDDILVIWVATRPKGNTEIVGWYKNARVYREPQTPNSSIDRWHEYEGEKENIIYRVVADEKDCTLLKESERKFKIISNGESNIRYKKNFDERVLKNGFYRLLCGYTSSPPQ